MYVLKLCVLLEKDFKNNNAYQQERQIEFMYLGVVHCQRAVLKRTALIGRDVIYCMCLGYVCC